MTCVAARWRLRNYDLPSKLKLESALFVIHDILADVVVTEFDPLEKRHNYEKLVNCNCGPYNTPFSKPY